MNENYRVSKAAYKASEPFFQRVKMTWKLIRMLFTLSIIVQVLFFSALIWLSETLTLKKLYYIVCYHFTGAFPFFSVPTFSDAGRQFVKGSFFHTFLEPFIPALVAEVMPFLYLTLLAYLIMPFGFIFFKRLSASRYKNTHIRGARLLTPKELLKSFKTDNLSGDIYISDNVFIPRKYESTHIIALGRPGTGKTVLISKIIEQVQKRNDKAIILDSKVDFICNFFRKDTDIIVNPFDVRGLKFNLLEEIDNVTDIDAICQIIIPDGGANESP
ncbi:MAG TPA: hypothetical protein DCX03_04455, partial [Bacteroidales bacterium]|nr:hypothetical protein [Bacteroidales bacterium]